MDKLELKHLRASLGLTIRELSELTRISETSLGDIENHKAKPRLVTSYAIVNALNQLLRTNNRPEISYQDINWEKE